MLKRFFTPNNPYPQQNYFPQDYDYRRLETELNESKRQIQDLSKRVQKLENYLGIQYEQNYNKFYN